MTTKTNTTTTTTITTTTTAVKDCIHKRWHGFDDQILLCNSASVVGTTVIRVCTLADLLIEKMQENDDNDVESVAIAVEEHCRILYFG